jgi:hypothetical protein
VFTQPQTLLNAVAATGVGPSYAFPLPECNWQKLGVEVQGTFVGTVTLEGTIAPQAEVNASSAVWLPITGASWTTQSLAGVDAPFTHVRGNVTAYTSGNITLRVI